MLHLLSDQAKTERLLRIKFFFKPEADRLKRVKRLIQILFNNVEFGKLSAVSQG